MNGGVNWIEKRPFKAFGAQGQELRFATYVRTQTTQREREKRFKTLIDAIETGAWRAINA